MNILKDTTNLKVDCICERIQTHVHMINNKTASLETRNRNNSLKTVLGSGELNDLIESICTWGFLYDKLCYLNGRLDERHLVELITSDCFRHIVRVHARLCQLESANDDRTVSQRTGGLLPLLESLINARHWHLLIVHVYCVNRVLGKFRHVKVNSFDAHTLQAKIIRIKQNLNF